MTSPGDRGSCRQDHMGGGSSSDQMFDPAAYGDSCASYYDQLYPSIESGLLDLLSSLAAGGPVLELGLATGRVASRLASAGIAMHGIDASASMLTKFRQRPDALLVKAVLGDFSALPYGHSFHLIFALASTIHLLPSLELQARCFRSVALALLPGGGFLAEASTSDREERTSFGHLLHTGSGKQTYRVTSLPTTALTLDRLAAESGLALEARWSNWRKAPFTSEAPRHISLYRLQKPPSA